MSGLWPKGICIPNTNTVTCVDRKLQRCTDKWTDRLTDLTQCASDHLADNHKNNTKLDKLMVYHRTKFTVKSHHEFIQCTNLSFKELPAIHLAPGTGCKIQNICSCCETLRFPTGKKASHLFDKTTVLLKFMSYVFKKFYLIKLTSKEL